MQSFEIVLILIAAAVGLTMLARWLCWPYPILLVIGGVLISLQPGAPTLALDPQVVFILFLPPLLYAGAFRTEWAHFRKYLRSITMLAVGLTLFTTLAVAAAAHYGIGMDWPVAFVLGAIVSPPDAVAAMAVTQQVKVPKTITTILEGESLVNDAAAIVAYRMGVACVVSGAFSMSEASLSFLSVSIGGIAFGLAAAWCVIKFHQWIEAQRLVDSKLTITITLLTPYAVYVPAEHLHISGVLAVVAAGLWIGHRACAVFECEVFHEAKSVWEWIEFLLNCLIFILIGSQLPAILEALDERHSLQELVQYAALIAGVVIVTRIIWMFPGAYGPRWMDRRIWGTGDAYPSWRSVIVVAWTGMRGVVSLACAMALPHEIDGGQPFPKREMIQFLTFWVIFATLVGQGLTLPLVIRWLGVDRFEPEPDPERATC